MLSKRVLVASILLPVGLFFVFMGETFFAAFIILLMVVSAWEYNRLMRKCGHAPNDAITLSGVALLCIFRNFFDFQYSDALLSLLILALITFHLLAYERGRDQSASDFGISLGGVIYLGWIGAYLISLRNLENGIQWLLLSLVCVWAADTAAYFFGVRFGKHRLSPRLSPKKSWEGYLAGVVAGVAMGPLMGWAFGLWSGPASGIDAWKGLILGVILASLTTLGDLGESLFKRQAGVKDSSNLLPGHGGVFDRVDSWLWAAVIGYYVITFFFI